MEKRRVGSFTRGQYARLAMTIVLVLLGWSWFALHLRRHVSLWTYGGVSVAALVGVGVSLWKLFMGDNLKSWPADWLKWPHTPRLLAVGLALVTVAHLTTSSIHVDADRPIEAGEVRRFEFYRDGSDVPVRTVALDAQHPQATLTFFRLIPFPMKVVTRVPPGYRDGEVRVGIGVRRLQVPDRQLRKRYHLVRLSSGQYLFSYRGRPPDEKYSLVVSVNGRRVVERHTLGFETIYLGAPADELRLATADVHGKGLHRSQLRKFLEDLDPTMPKEVVDKLIEAWVARPIFVGTPQFGPKDEVRVLITMSGQPIFNEIMRPSPIEELATTFIRGAGP